MELLYVWVEDFKNIKRQGFNFSSEFEIKFTYDEDIEKEMVEYEFIVNKKQCAIGKDYNFFGNKINNIVAINGKNGTGKSSLLYLINQLLNFVFRDISYMKEEVKGLLNTNWVCLFKKDETIYHLSYFENNGIEYQEAEIIGYPITCSDFKDLKKYDIFNLPKDNDNKMVSAIQFDFKKNIEISPLCLLETFDYYMYFFSDIKLFEEATVFLPNKDNILIDKKFREEFKELFSSEIKKYKTIEIIEKLKKYISSIDDVSKINDLITIEYTYKHSDGEINLLQIINTLWRIKRDIFTFKKNNSEFKPLFFGFYLLLDEPDTTLHPENQRSFLNKMIKFINESGFFISNINIIITTHSPFIISDLPRENVIMLNTDKDGNCIVRNDKKDKEIKTFGANIFDLYTEAFFVESNFGEFAKRKIKEVVKDLTPNEDGKYNSIKEERIKEIEYILNSIGEPLVKNKMKKMYDEYKEFKIRKLSDDEKNKKILEAIKNSGLNEEEFKKYFGDKND